MIDAATNTVSATIPGFVVPVGVAVTPDRSKVYVANDFTPGGGGGGGHLAEADSVSVIDTATNTVSATIPVGVNPIGVAVTPDGSKVYITNEGSGTVSVIDAATNTVSATIPGFVVPIGVAVTPDGSKVYVANQNSNTVSVIDTATNTVIATIPVGSGPVAFGVFIQRPTFAGVPGSKNCHGKSVSALATEFGGLNAAAAALGFSSGRACRMPFGRFVRDSSSHYSAEQSEPKTRFDTGWLALKHHRRRLTAKRLRF